jgi:TatD DNase family protein
MSFALVDTHCHIHSNEYKFDIDRVFHRAKANHVDKVLLVATGIEDCAQALAVAERQPIARVIAGIHPHDAKNWPELALKMTEIYNSGKIVGIGEIGLDYFYNLSDEPAQETALRAQLEVGLALRLPFSFHVREGFQDFFRIIDEMSGIRGVVHSFTGTFEEAIAATTRDLYLGMGGIMTFSKNPDHARVIREIPLEKMLLETDAPFLTPVPLRGTINEPTNVTHIAQFIADARGVCVDEVARITSDNAQRLFSL